MTWPAVDSRAWQDRVVAYASQFAKDFGQAKTAGWAVVYLQGLLGNVDRKSIESLSRQVIIPPGLPHAAPKQALHHFICNSPWDEGRIYRRYRRLMAEAFASDRGRYVVNSIGFRKRGRNSVGVHRQPCGPSGRETNCQIAVAVHYAGPSGHFPLGLRLFLPPAWVDDPGRLDQAGVPESERRHRTTGQIALDLIDRVRDEGVPGWAVVAGPEFGASAVFRQGLTARGLPFVVQIPRAMQVYETGAVVVADAGRSEQPAARWAPQRVDEVARRHGTPADGSVGWHAVWPADDRNPGVRPAAPQVRLVALPRLGGKSPRYCFAGLPSDYGPMAALNLLEGLDQMDRDYDLIGPKLGLYHFEGRSWPGFHHHACMLMVAFGFLALHAGASRPEKPAFNHV